jgi:hypothetical protein
VVGDPGPGEMGVRGTILLRTTADIAGAECSIMAWPNAAMGADGSPDHSLGIGMLDEVPIRCPRVPDVAAPFYTVLRVGIVGVGGDTGTPVEEIEEFIALIAKVRASDHITESPSSINPVTVDEATVVEGAIFDVEVATAPSK